MSIRNRWDVARFAETLGVSTSFVYSKVKAGELPHERVGGRILIDPGEVERLLKSQRVTADEALAKCADSVAYR